MNVSEEKISVHMTVSVQHSCRGAGSVLFEDPHSSRVLAQGAILGLVSSGIYDSLSLECLGLGMQTPCKDETDGEARGEGESRLIRALGFGLESSERSQEEAHSEENLEIPHLVLKIR